MSSAGITTKGRIMSWRYNGTPFTDRGFENIPSLVHLESWLQELIRAA